MSGLMILVAGAVPLGHGGPSAGADLMVATARRLGKTVFTSLDEVPAP